VLNGDGKPVGLIDTLDILYAAVKEAERRGVPLSALAEGDRPDLPFLENMPVEKYCSFVPSPPPPNFAIYHHLVDASGRNGCCLAYQGLPLSGVMDILSSRTQIHRLPVVDKEGRLVGKNIPKDSLY